MDIVGERFCDVVAVPTVEIASNIKPARQWCRVANILSHLAFLSYPLFAPVLPLVPAEVIKSKGLEKITVDDLVADITPRGRGASFRPCNADMLSYVYLRNSCDLRSHTDFFNWRIVPG